MSKQNPDGAEQEFFAALIEADRDRAVIANDFLLIDVMTCSEVSKAALLEIVAARELRFKQLNRIDFRVRVYAAMAVITGQTKMIGGFDGQPFEVDSR